MKTTAIKIYYLFLSTLIFAAAVQTIYTGSIHISSGRELAKLEKQQQQLVNQKQKLEQQVALASSLNTANQFALAQQYQPVVGAMPVAVTSSMMASR
jgi:hypothetical protein